MLLGLNVAFEGYFGGYVLHLQGLGVYTGGRMGIRMYLSCQPISFTQIWHMLRFSGFPRVILIYSLDVIGSTILVVL